MTLKLTCSTMFNPTPELHTRFDEVSVHIKASLGKEISLFIDGKDIS